MAGGCTFCHFFLTNYAVRISWKCKCTAKKLTMEEYVNVNR